MNYVLIEKHSNQYNAGSKARKDIDSIAVNNNYRSLILNYIDSVGNKNVLNKIIRNISGFFGWLKILFLVKKGDTILIQHPINTGVYSALVMLPVIKFLKKCRFVGLIHDLATLRGMGCDRKTADLHDYKILSVFDTLICHNDYMKKILKEKYPVSHAKLVSLGIFDYLHDCNVCSSRFEKSVIVAGNLSREKCPYIGQLIDNYNGVLHLYGVGLTEDIQKTNIVYHGAFSPEELPGRLQGNFGLVWDGISMKTCDGNTGNYLRYNNPHKVSLYLSSGIPVIIWKEAAMADFIIKNKAGIVVESLENLSDVLDNISEASYEEMCQNALRVSEKLKKGFYTTCALKKC